MYIFNKKGTSCKNNAKYRDYCSFHNKNDSNNQGNVGIDFFRLFTKMILLHVLMKENYRINEFFKKSVSFVNVLNVGLYLCIIMDIRDHGFLIVKIIKRKI